jgi:hypothetical protein
MKNLFIIGLLIILSSCKQKAKLHYNMTATCEKIIVQDTVDNYVVHFLVSFKNPNPKDVLIFSNTCEDGYESKNYYQAGIYLKKDKEETALGQFNRYVFFRIKAGQTFKILYTYNDIYPNKKIDFNTKESLETKFKSVDLYYKSDKIIIEKLLQKIQKQKEDVIIDIPDFKVDMSNATTVFKKDLNIEEAINLVDGKIIKGK